MPGQSDSNINRSSGRRSSAYKDTQLSSIAFQRKKDFLQRIGLIAGALPPICSENKEGLLHALNGIRNVQAIAQLRVKLWSKNPILGCYRTSNVLGNTYCERVNLCKPIMTQLPEKLRNMIHCRKHFRTGRRMVRASPEKEMGLTAIMRPASRIKDFTFEERLNYSYLFDNRFLLLYCLLIGFSISWAYLPLDMVDRHNINPLSAAIIQPLKVLFIDNLQGIQDISITEEIRVAATQQLEQWHQGVAYLEQLLHPDYDPLNLPRDIAPELQMEPVQQPRRGKRLAILIGAIILCLALNEAVVPSQILLS